MSKKNKKMKIDENYLERVPVRRESVEWTLGDDGMVTISIHNKGFFNKIAQIFFKKPKISYVHLEENGSFIWQSLDGERDIIKIGELVRERFGEKAEPLYERLAKYIAMLVDCGFAEFK